MENMTSPGTLLSGDNATWLEEYYQTGCVRRNNSRKTGGVFFFHLN